jgi:phosphatidylserine decarboxylase
MDLWNALLKKLFGEKSNMKIARGSISWILTTFILGCFFLILSVSLTANIRSTLLFVSSFLLLLTGFFLLFFRDPERNIGKGIVASADGKIREISSIEDEDIGECMNISTFMNVYNVHVNRMPLDGTIKNIVHLPGAHLPAFKKESERNERVIVTIDTEIGIVKVIQIAGTLARRIVPYVKKGDKLKKGEKIGIIRLGSRVDIYIPSKKIKTVHVKIGDMIKAGVDTIAEIND